MINREEGETSSREATWRTQKVEKSIRRWKPWVGLGQIRDGGDGSLEERRYYSGRGKTGVASRKERISGIEEEELEKI